PPPTYIACLGLDHYRSRYAGRHRTSLPPSSYDRSQGFVSDDAYARQPFRQQYYHEGQQEGHGKGSFRFDRSHPISLELDRRSVASSLYSHPFVSKRRVGYFRKKAEKFYRPMRGATPLLKKNQVQCGSCLEIITLKPKQVKVHPVIPPSSFPVSKGVRSRGSSHRGAKNNFNFYKLQAHDVRRQKDFADNVSPSSTFNYGRIDIEHGSNRSIRLKSVPVDRSRFSNDLKDILCQGDTGGQLEASGQCTISPQGSILRKECDINTKSGYEATVRGESLSRKCIHKSKEGYNYNTFPSHFYFSIKGQSSQDILYDYRAGFWGVFGQECRGIILKDFDLLVGRGLPRMPGKSYSIEISRSVVDDTTGVKVRRLGKL
ncbi:hypothetical protein ACJX0J_019930, partial [Zea mays]